MRALAWNGQVKNGAHADRKSFIIVEKSFKGVAAVGQLNRCIAAILYS